MKKKIKINDDEYKKLLELIQMGVMLERTGKILITKGQNVLSSLATYGVETPKRSKMEAIRPPQAPKFCINE